MLVISPQQPCGIGRYSLVSGNSPMRALDLTNHLQCLPQSIKVSPRRDEGIPPYRLLALPAAYYKKLCRERLIPVQEPNQRSAWPLKFDCGRSDLPYIFRITLPAKNLSPFYPIRPEKYVDKPRFIWYIIQAIFCGHGPLVKRLRQRPLTPLTSVRFRYGSPYAPLAQLVEQLTLNQWAQGSSPWRCTKKCREIERFHGFFVFCNTAARFLHGRCTVRVFCVELCRARDCIAIRALFCIQVNSARRSCAFVSGSASFRSSKSAAMESAVFPWTGGVWALASGLA